MEKLETLSLLSNLFTNSSSLVSLLIHFSSTALVILLIIRFFYYPKSLRRDYCFTFFLISISVFMMIFLLGNVELKIGFTLGLFAVFGILRYRTETMPVREMTYLFIIIAISVINALIGRSNYLELILPNILFIACVWLSESNHWLKPVSSKLIKYDKIDLILPENRSELLKDIKSRTGLDVFKVEIGNINFLKDSATIKVYYKSNDESSFSFNSTIYTNNEINEIL
ncbi:MAG: DUF4956 domain-containing protein [Bacteroidales bacterium]